MLYGTIHRSMEPNEQTPISPAPENAERFVSTPGPEVQGDVSRVPSPEQAPRVESKEQVTGQGAGDAASFALPTPAIAAPLQQAPAQVSPKNDPSQDNPLAADDVDVIEKEWVDRAKKIIQQTKNDPYQQEHEVSRLQADYLEKRFGVQVKLPQGQ